MEENELIGEMEKILKQLSPEQQKYLLEQACAFLHAEAHTPGDEELAATGTVYLN